MKKKRFSLFLKMGLIYGLVFALCLTLLATIITIINYGNQRDSSLSLSREIVIARSREVGEWLNTFVAETKVIASNSILKIGDKNLIKDELNLIVKNFDESHEAPAFVDLNGDYITAEGLTGNVADRVYYKEMVVNKKIFYISNPVISRVSNELISPITYRVLDKDNKLIGMYMEPVRLNYLAQVVTEIKIGKNGEAWITDGTGMIIAHPNKELINELNVLKSDDVGYKGLKEAGEEMMLQKTGDNLVIRPDGSKSYIIYAPIPDSPGWSIAITLAVFDVLKDSITSAKTAAAISFVLLVVVIILTLIISGSIVKPIRSIAFTARELSVGNIELKGMDNKKEKNKLLNRNDELGDTANAMEGLIDYISEKEAIARQMATGDFNVNPRVVSNTDNFGIAYKNLVESLNTSLSNVIRASEQVDMGSNQVAQASQALSQGATEQASSLEEITSSITEINSQAKQNSENALQASGLAKQAMENAEGGNKQMQELVDAMGNITKSAEAIKSIVKVIDDIAFQTNLLALNANVEAARAGKYGKGFAVVAEEVRNLAGRSAVSVKETTDMVEDTVKNILNGNNLVDITAKQLEEITNGSNKVADLVEEIATASKEQTQGLDQISQGLSQIDQVTQSNTASAEESASAAEELAGQAVELKVMVNKFKLKKTSGTEEIDYNMINTKRSSIEEKKISINPKDVIRLNDADFGKF